jgi:hypothetical protein
MNTRTSQKKLTEQEKMAMPSVYRQNPATGRFVKITTEMQLAELARMGPPILRRQTACFSS